MSIRFVNNFGGGGGDVKTRPLWQKMSDANRQQSWNLIQCFDSWESAEVNTLLMNNWKSNTICFDDDQVDLEDESSSFQEFLRDYWKEVFGKVFEFLWKFLLSEDIR